jgi:hypothetical protein
MAADTRDLVNRPYLPFLRDVFVASQLLRRDGYRATVGHAIKVALRRLHSAAFDRPLMAGLPHPLHRQSLLTGLTLRTAMTGEPAGAAPCSPVPAKTFDWAIRGSGIDPAAWHFVDIGSGTGWGLQLAMRYAFRAFTGVEFAYEIHQKARENIAWLTAQGRTHGRPVHLRHESALETELPAGPCVLLVFSPFDENVMRPFVRLIERSVADNPRPIVVLYVNPVHHALFERRGIREIALIPYYRRMIRFLSAHSVRAYRFGPQTALKPDTL